MIGSQRTNAPPDLSIVQLQMAQVPQALDADEDQQASCRSQVVGEARLAVQQDDGKGGRNGNSQEEIATHS